MKVLVATEKPFAAVAVDGIRKVIEDAGYTLELLEKYTDKSQLLEAVASADALIIRSDVVDAQVLDAAKNLKVVVRAGAGYDNVDLAAATAHGVCVENTPGQNSNAVAELVFGMTVMAVRNMGIDYLRRRSSRREDPVGDSTDISDASMVDDDDESAKAERLADVTRIIERELTERQCSILYMRDRYGYSIEEIACHYSLSEANVRMILSRARNTVRECYIKYRQK